MARCCNNQGSNNFHLYVKALITSRRVRKRWCIDWNGAKSILDTKVVGLVGKRGIRIREMLRVPRGIGIRAPISEIQYVVTSLGKSRISLSSSDAFFSLLFDQVARRFVIGNLKAQFVYGLQGGLIPFPEGLDKALR